MYAFAESFAAVRSLVTDSDTHLINFVAGFGHTLGGSYLGVNGLTVAQQIQQHGLPFRTANAIDELSPVLNFLAIDGLDGIAFLQSGAVSGAARCYFVKYGKEWRVTEQTVGAGGIAQRGLHRAPHAAIFYFGAKGTARSLSLDGFGR